MSNYKISVKASKMYKIEAGWVCDWFATITNKAGRSVTTGGRMSMFEARKAAFAKARELGL